MISDAFGFGDQRQKSTVEQHIEIFGGLIIIVVFQSILMLSTMNTSFPLLFNLSNRCFGVSRKCSRSFDGCR